MLALIYVVREILTMEQTRAALSRMTSLKSLNMTGSVSVAAMNANPQVMEEHN